MSVSPENRWIAQQPPSPYRRPCIVVPSLESDKHCGAPAGSHTALDFEICDECYSHISEAGLVPGPKVLVLGAFDE